MARTNRFPASTALGAAAALLLGGCGSPGGGNCLVAVDPRAPETWHAGRTTSGVPATSGPTGVRAEFAPAGPDRDEPPSGWTRLIPELQVTGG